MNNNLQLLIKNNDIDNIKKVFVDNRGWMIMEMEYNKNGQMPILMYAMQYSYLTDYYSSIELIVENILHINIQDRRGDTALMHAIKNIKFGNTYDVISLLLQKGIDPNIKNKDGYTSLMLISKFTHNKFAYNICKLLLNYGADPNIPLIDKYGEPEFAMDMIAKNYAKVGNYEKQIKANMIELLCKNGSHNNYKKNSEINIVQTIIYKIEILKLKTMKNNYEQKIDDLTKSLEEQKKIFEEKIKSCGKRKHSEISNVNSNDLPNSVTKKTKKMIITLINKILIYKKNDG